MSTPRSRSSSMIILRLPRVALLVCLLGTNFFSPTILETSKLLYCCALSILILLFHKRRRDTKGGCSLASWELEKQTCSICIFPKHRNRKLLLTMKQQYSRSEERR